MKKQKSPAFSILLLTGLCVILIGAQSKRSGKKRLKHQLYIEHPGKALGEAAQLTLVEEVQATGESLFFMDVVSVYCSDSVCKIDTVCLFWNSIGSYIRYQLAPTIYLEKAEGKKFTEEEYDRLQLILSDQNSSFKDLAIDQIVKTNDVEHGMDLDGYSGATVIELDEKESVKGAALTCYTLWHWANGPIRDSIRKITGDALAVHELNAMLYQGKDAYTRFALEQLTDRMEYGSETVKGVIENHIKDADIWSKLQVQYFENAPKNTYFTSMKQLMEKGNKQQRINVLQSLNKTEYDTHQSYYDGLCLFLNKLDSYREVDLFISLMEGKNASSEMVIEAIIGLLDKNILIARRAYWFLSYQRLKPSQQNMLEAFYKKNEEYL